jgi:hypothetical protein
MRRVADILTDNGVAGTAGWTLRLPTA